jgi:hypothetical protein
MTTQLDVRSESAGGEARPEILLNYHGACTKPFVLPLSRHLLFKTARRYDIYGELPTGAVPYRDPNDWVDAKAGSVLKIESQPQWASVRCGKCEACAYRRYMRYATAAKGWFRTTRLSMFVSFTFSNQWFARRWANRHAAKGDLLHSALSHLEAYDASETSLGWSFEELPQAYDANDPDHFSAVRQWLGDERTRFLKRFRQSLNRRAVFKGVKLSAHVELMELGDLRGRPHLHGLFHVDYDGEDEFEIDGSNPDLYLHLREEMKRQWDCDGEGVGFIDCKRVSDEHGGPASADYVFKYLLKLIRSNDESKRIAAETRIATSLAYIGKGRLRYDSTTETGEVLSDEGGQDETATVHLWPSGRVLGTPAPQGEGDGLEIGADADLDRTLATGGVKGISDSEIPYSVQSMALKIADARELWNVGDLWPGTNHGADLPETDWRWLPAHESDFMGWLGTTFSPYPPAEFINPSSEPPSSPSEDWE